MKCTSCQIPFTYNRAVVDPSTGDVLGCLCTHCIDDYFGRALAAYVGGGSTCVRCDRLGDVALPEWRCTSVEDEDCVVVTGVDASVSPRTPHLCESHLGDLRGEGTARDRAVPSRARR
ncbi:hypothetical protein [Halomicrobium urmianum]|uniref:hypothetical protein n=1 Tax=Halomicrobium urmianum TaxID=1586233 RepID=UPI001CDA2F54|nr:hypothetical protein [Halomicrobium urmianum]